MAMEGLTRDQLTGLCNILDETNGQSRAAMKRPASQSVGYSLAEADPTDAGERAAAGMDGTENTKENPYASKHSVSAVSNPGAIYVPDSVKDRKVLPVPSKSKEALKAGSSGRPKPKGNDIWTTEEVEMESNLGGAGAVIAAALKAAEKTDAVAPTTSAPIAPRTAAVDRRVAPEYEILYKQVNTAEDVYLSMDFTRDGSTAFSCESLAVKIQLPLLESVKDVELDVEPFVLTLRSRDYHLKAHLPEKVLAKKGNAQWDANKKVMTVIVTVDPSDRKVKVM